MHRQVNQVGLLAALLLAVVMASPSAGQAYFETEDRYGPGYNQFAVIPETDNYAPYALEALNRSAAGEGAGQAALLPSPIKYQVNKGDTLYRIARAFDVSVSSLIAANDIEDPGRLTVGQQLEIPAEGAQLMLPNGEERVIEKVLQSTLTAYTAGAESTGKRPSHPAYGITSSGSKAEEGRTIAVDPSVIPIGTLVYIDGIGLRKAEDTGSAIKGARVDVFMNDVKQAIQFGVKKNVKVYVLSSDNA
ncbi:3D domain-containing protein [Paenibacillus ginsengihumi]|uniref:3D domain-containing protein n=1 Tax=Paenibacillus ginsengihumi TaxID=431596 RepID=UPI000382D285|nr:3D domain-containing protein [Paenibacillus ginsengihumi]